MATVCVAASVCVSSSDRVIGLLANRWFMKLLLPLYVVVFISVASISNAEEALESSAASVAPVASRGVDIFTVISSVSQRTHRKFLIGPDVHASVDLVGIEPREVSYALLLTILQVHGFYAYEREGVVVIDRDTNLRQAAPGRGATDVSHAGDEDVVTTVVEVKNGRAIWLVPVLRPLMPQTAQLQAVSDHNALIIVDRAANVRRIIGLINELEKLPVTKTE